MAVNGFTGQHIYVGRVLRGRAWGYGSIVALRDPERAELVEIGCIHRPQATSRCTSRNGSMNEFMKRDVTTLTGSALSIEFFRSDLLIATVVDVESLEIISHPQPVIVFPP